jgi:hypothetical protein
MFCILKQFKTLNVQGLCTKTITRPQFTHLQQAIICFKHLNQRLNKRLKVFNFGLGNIHLSTHGGFYKFCVEHGKSLDS